MLWRASFAVLVLSCGAFSAAAPMADLAAPDLDSGFSDAVRPFLAAYCTSCHGGTEPEGEFDLTAYDNAAAVIRDHERWALVLEKISSLEMPPEGAEKHPTADERERVIVWIKTLERSEALKNAGDPGIVVARRLSNSEYNYTIRDLTGVDIRPTREFPVDPANPAGFDNSGESLAMSPTLLEKYLQAAREVADHLVLKPDGLAFAPHPMLVETDRDKYCVNQIMDFYSRQVLDFADYFQTAWRYKHRTALGKPDATLKDVAEESGVSAKYLHTVWHLLEEVNDDVGPTAKLQKMWKALPVPNGNDVRIARGGCEQMRSFVHELRAKLEPRFANVSGGQRLDASSQPLLMWKNRQYATHRMRYERRALQIDGQAQPAQDGAFEDEPDTENEFGPGATRPVKNKPGDPDLFVPAGQQAEYEAAFARFCAVFPDAFVVSERGRNYFDKSKDRGRYLSAGFHNLMGYFRDDQPLYELILDEVGQKELDALWKELDFIALATHRTYVQFYLNEAREAREVARQALADDTLPEDKEITSERMVKQVAESYLARARENGNEVVVRAVQEHFDWVNATLRWVEQTKIEAEPKHLQALQELASRACRRPLSADERDELIAFYQVLCNEHGLDHEAAIRDSLVSILMSPDFCYRIDLVDEGEGVRPLSNYALASRLSYFLWSSMPDDALLARAAAGELHRPEVLTAEARRMLKDERIRGLAVEFGGNWLEFRRFEELNTVDRERFSSFDNELRDAMFEEPIQFMLDVFRENRSVLDFLYAEHTFVNPVLAKHYGVEAIESSPDVWRRVDDASRYDRGGLLPMAAFLTRNAPGLRTSPVKRGYWVVKNVLGERIPPPPAAVPELPRDEANLGNRTLREALAQHRNNPGCASCHDRFDSLGLVFEGFGPIGERRDVDLSGNAVDARAVFPGGSEGAGVDGLRKYIRAQRQDDFLDNLCRKLLAYALGRSLTLSDEPTIAEMRAKLANTDYRFATLVESIVASRQFITKRGPDRLTLRGD
jgi:hypothetical protein